jgi:hypothetical protein
MTKHGKRYAQQKQNNQKCLGGRWRNTAAGTLKNIDL